VAAAGAIESISSTSRSFSTPPGSGAPPRASAVIVSPAGSGKTAVTLAKMREATGNVLYVTLGYLAPTARRLYGAHG
jgi:hypothetical protein